MTKIYIGTSGFSYDDWIGLFYPSTLNRKDWLSFYAKHFKTTELNVTFYRTPFEGMFKSWYSKTSQGFLFAVKCSRFITHVKKIKKGAVFVYFNNDVSGYAIKNAQELIALLNPS